MAVADAPVNLHQIPIKALQGPTKLAIEAMLNPLKVIPTEDGLPRDWRGLAHLAGLNREAVSIASLSGSPVDKVLDLWKDGTLGLLQDYLGRLDRWDVVDDTSQRMEVDAKEYEKSLERAATSAEIFDEDLDKKILTKDDVLRLDQGLEPQRYHAYLLYADEDVDFAMKIVTEMETKYALKLCLRDRDLVGGHMFEHEAIMKLISDRCNRLIVILSPNFLKSEANKFFVTFAQALGIDQKGRKVIPVMYERCPLPPELSYYFLLDYARSGHLWDFWQKLNDSIQAPTMHKNGYVSSIQVRKSEAVPVEDNPTKEIASAPMKTMVFCDPPEEEEKPALGSQSNISQSSLLHSKRYSSNSSLSKKSFSGSLESLKGKTLKLFRSVSNHKRKEKQEVAASEC